VVAALGEVAAKTGRVKKTAALKKGIWATLGAQGKGALIADQWSLNAWSESTGRDSNSGSTQENKGGTRTSRSSRKETGRVRDWGVARLFPPLKRLKTGGGSFGGQGSRSGHLSSRPLRDGPLPKTVREPAWPLTCGGRMLNKRDLDCTEKSKSLKSYGSARSRGPCRSGK